MKMLACDDRNPQPIVDGVSGAKEAFAEWAEPEQLGLEALELEIKTLFTKIKSLLSGDSPDPVTSKFDGYQVVLLDYGLTVLQFDIRLTADHVAGYLRAFSEAAYIVSLNKLPHVDFDLKYLVGDFESRADLALKTEHLSEPGLWNGRNEPGAFCPWYWPTLQTAAVLRGKQIALIEADPDKPILATLGFPERLIPFLSRQAIAFLSPDAEDVQGNQDVRNVSFWHHFQRSNRSLPKDDRVALAEVLGGADAFAHENCPDSPYLRTIVARVVAGELDFWFRRDVLGPQKLLVDTPHLQAHLRFRIGEGAEDPEVWAATAHKWEPPYGLDPQLLDALSPEALFVDTPWLDRPAFWLPLVDDSEAVAALAENAVKSSSLVFCEDTRRFRERSSAKRFVTELTKGLDVRFIEGVGENEYSPKSLFAR